MAKGVNQKIKLLVLKQILVKYSDENHPLTVQQIIELLQLRGIPVERKTIYDDIAILQQYGLDIVVQRGKRNMYYLAEREFQLPELKLLVDAALYAKFITAKKSQELIRKISGFASIYQAEELKRQVHINGRVKTMNEGIYYVVDTLQTAITQNKQIEFKYFQWEIDEKAGMQIKRVYRHNGKFYKVSPWALVWNEENYYLVAYDENVKAIRHYRVDKMDSLQIQKEDRNGKNLFEELDMAEYTKSVFGMFGGKVQQIEIRFAKHLIGVVVDRFGKSLQIYNVEENYFSARIQAVVSAQFIAWILSFEEEAQVIAPQFLRNKICNTLEKVRELYIEK